VRTGRNPALYVILLNKKIAYNALFLVCLRPFSINNLTCGTTNGADTFCVRLSGRRDNVRSRSVWDDEEMNNMEEGAFGNMMVSRRATLIDSISPLLTSMKLFGMYFRCRTDVSDKSTAEKSRVQWSGYLIYAVGVVVLSWVNALRMFSVFTKNLY